MLPLSRARCLAVFIFALMVAPRGSGQVFWSNHSLSSLSDEIWCVTFGNGTFAAVTNQGNLLTSPDGKSWAIQSIDRGIWLVSIAYGNGLWIAVGDGGTILESTDLRIWTQANSGTPNRLNGVAYGGGAWVAVGEHGTILTSVDAVVWETQPAVPGATGYLHALVYTPQGFFAGGEDGILLCGVTKPGTLTDYVFSVWTVHTADPPLVFGAIEALVDIGDSPFEQVLGVGQQDIFSAGSWDDRGILHYLQTMYSPPLYSGNFQGMTSGDGNTIAVGEFGAIFRTNNSQTMPWLQSFAGDSPTTVSTATLLSATFAPELHRFVTTGMGGTILVSDSNPSTLGNVSSRGLVSPGQSFIGGFVVQGSVARSVLIRADGPALGEFGVPSPLKDPVLTVFDSTGKAISSNAGWSGAANVAATAAAVGAFPLPSASADSALVLSLAPGAYTAVITSASNSTGAVLFEAYLE